VARVRVIAWLRVRVRARDTAIQTLMNSPNPNLTLKTAISIDVFISIGASNEGNQIFYIVLQHPTQVGSLSATLLGRSAHPSTFGWEEAIRCGPVRTWGRS